MVSRWTGRCSWKRRLPRRQKQQSCLQVLPPVAFRAADSKNLPPRKPPSATSAPTRQACSKSEAQGEESYRVRINRPMARHAPRLH